MRETVRWVRPCRAITRAVPRACVSHGWQAAGRGQGERETPMQPMEPHGTRVPYPHPQMTTPSGDGLATAAPRWGMAALTPRQVVREHELRRRHRLGRIIALGIMVGAGVLIPSALVPSFNPATLAALVIAFVGTSLAYLLSRSGFVTAAGYAVVLSLVVAIAFEVVGKSIHQGGLDLSDLRIFDIFVLPILLSGVLIDRRGTILVETLISAFPTATLLVL